MASFSRRFEIIDHHQLQLPTPFLFPSPSSSILSPFDLDLDSHFHHQHHHHPSLDILDVVFPSPIDHFSTDLLYIGKTTPSPFRFHSRYNSHHHHRHLRGVDRGDLYIQSLSDRVADLESKFERLLELKGREKKVTNRKYTWTAEIEDEEVERKYKWTTEIKGKKEERKRCDVGGGERKYHEWMAEIKGDDKLKEGEKKRKGKGVKGGDDERRKYEWTAEIKGKGDEKRKYTWTAEIGGGDGKKKEEVEKKREKYGGSGVARIVEIEEGFDDHGALILRQAFQKRAGAAIEKGKRKELSPQDAALMIQISFRDYLIRRSRALRALRELAIAKSKLKEIRALFHNFSYRNRLARDGEERQKFTEKIIVLLLTVDAIEGADLMVRSAKKSMVDELEAMLDVVDPHPAGRSLSIRRRTFDMPTGDMQKEIAEGVASVVQMLDEE